LGSYTDMHWKPLKVCHTCHTASTSCVTKTQVIKVAKLQWVDHVKTKWKGFWNWNSKVYYHVEKPPTKCHPESVEYSP
jgi:hypothetical protein